MGTKRKRTRSLKVNDTVNINKLAPDRIEYQSGNPLRHPTLRLYYKQISTLGEYLLSQLPKASRKRRRRIVNLQRIVKEGDGTKIGLDGHYRDVSLAKLLDQTVVCSVDIDPEASEPVYSAQDFEAFTQQINPTAASGIADASLSQSDLVDFAISLLFHRVHRQSYRPSHMLCHGYQRAKGPRQAGDDMCAILTNAGIISLYPNGNVSILKSAEWNDVLGLLGKDGDKVMLRMIVHSAIFTAVQSGRGNLIQLCGTPLADLEVLKPAECMSKSPKTQWAAPHKPPDPAMIDLQAPRNPASICFVRRRMFYARATLSTKGKVTSGLRHIHALNRYPCAHNSAHTLRLLQYIFPREFGLHNVFTSASNQKETTQPFNDYTLRESEICRKEHNLRSGEGNVVRQRIPKRLRGMPVDLVRKLQRLHSRCSYLELLKYYCPTRSSQPTEFEPTIQKASQASTIDFVTQSSNQIPAAESLSTTLKAPIPDVKPSLFDLATPHANVSAFCRATILKLIPRAFWGKGDPGRENEKNLMCNIDRFVRLRKFEHMSLHLVSQRFKIKPIDWLLPLNINSDTRLSQTDMRKRKEMLMEFLYYVFDSILIPLIRSNFYVTESNVHQNRVFYFRHDVWRTLTEPAMTKLKLNLFEEIKTPKAKRLLDARTLGFSQIRLLPKSTGLRPITNLRRRMTKLKDGKMELGKSINKIMTPVHKILDLQKRILPSLTGSALFSVGEMYPKLKQFAATLDPHSSPLYFAKADAQSCFDTIPQREVIALMEKIVSKDEYRIAWHSEIKASNQLPHQSSRNAASKAARKFKTTARVASDFDPFAKVVETSLAPNKKNMVFVDSIVQQPQEAEEALDLLGEHIQRNVIKIGKKFFRQTCGIPQGSVVSSLLCNYFYAEMEREHFHFLNHDESILLRLIDDFLLITTNKDHAKKFLQIMHDGVQKYGVSINPAKSLVNFDVVINGHKVPQQPHCGKFPYCGNMVDTRTLEITKDRDRRMQTVLANTLTIDPSKAPGKAFYRKTLHAFKIQMHKMFLDTQLNSPGTVLSTIYQNFAETAMKCYRYAKCMPPSKHPSSELVIGEYSHRRCCDLLYRHEEGWPYHCAAQMKRLTKMSSPAGTIYDLIDLAYVLSQGKHHAYPTGDYACAVSKNQVRWLASRAFHRVLEQKQTRYREVVTWLEGVMVGARAGRGRDMERLERTAQEGDAVFSGYKF